MASLPPLVWNTVVERLQAADRLQRGCVDSVYVSVRQTVLSGSVDASGFPNALSAGAGLSVTLSAASTAFVLAFAAGFDQYGSVDYAGSFSSNQSFASLTASTTCFLYVDRSTSGTLTTGFVTLATVYQYVAPSSPASNQHWFDLANFVMKYWNGSSWVTVQRVFVGEAVTGSSSITSVTNYAYQRRYQSAWTSIAANSSYTFAHNLGMSLSSAQASCLVIGRQNSADSAPHPVNHWLFAGSDSYGFLSRASLISNGRTGYGVQSGAYVYYTGILWLTSAEYQVLIKGGW